MRILVATLVAFSLVVLSIDPAYADNSKEVSTAPRTELIVPTSVQPGQTFEVPVNVHTGNLSDINVGEFLLIYPVEAIASVSFKAADGITTITQPRREDEGPGKFYLAYGVLGGTLRDGQKVATLNVVLKDSLPSTLTMQLRRNNMARAGMPVPQVPDTTYSIKVEQPIPGDVDRDGRVNIRDFSLLVSTFGACQGQSAYSARTDFDQNGCITIQDLLVLHTNFSRRTSSLP